MEDEAYRKLDRIRKEYYFKHPAFKFLLNKDASLYLKDKIREKQADINAGRISLEQHERFRNGTLESILDELMEETKINNPQEEQAYSINKDLEEAQEILRKG